MLGNCTYTIYNLTRHDYPSVIGEELAYYIIIIVIIIIIINITVTYKLIFLSFQVSIPYITMHNKQERYQSKAKLLPIATPFISVIISTFAHA